MVNIDIDPVLWHWVPFTVGWHGVWLALALLLGYWIALRQARQLGITSGTLTAGYCVLVVLGYIGGRLLYVAQHWELYAQRPAAIPAIYEGGWSILGSVIVGVPAIAIYAWRTRLPAWSLADLAAIGCAAGEIVGRVGCTINGDVRGIPTHAALGLVYRHPNALVPPELLGVPLYPVPSLYQVVCAGLLILLLLVRRKHPRPGTLSLLYLMGYAAGRSLISPLQESTQIIPGINTTQALSAGIITLVLVLVCCRNRRASPITSS